MREFNTFGPVNPQYHFHVNRIDVKATLREKIEKGRYMTLNAARQTGKTTLFRELIEELGATGDYFGILLDFEQLADFKEERFYERLGQTVSRWQSHYYPSTPEPKIIHHQGDFVDWLRATVLTVGKRGVLIIDEFDAISVE